MTFYELATLKTVIFGAAKAAPAIEAWLAAPEARGRLLGAWSSDIGRLNEVYLLRGFDSREELAAERARTERSADPFGCADLITALDLRGYAPFDFVGPVETGDFGPFYEIRSYRLKPNGLHPTLDNWRQAVPERLGYSPLTVALYALDGPPTITHIWPYRSLDERRDIRTRSIADGKWPPKGGPDWLTPDMHSTIALPLGFSPLK